MDEAVSALAARLARRLKAVDGTICCAESCTGGLLSSTLTDLSGASSWYRQSWITYTNEAKQKHLGVPEETLENHGAVSAEVALAMANGARERAGTTLAISITGIAGPTADAKESFVTFALQFAIAQWDYLRAKDAKAEADAQERKELIRMREEEQRLKRVVDEAKAKADAPWQDQVWGQSDDDRDIGGDVEWDSSSE